MECSLKRRLIVAVHCRIESRLRVFTSPMLLGRLTLLHLALLCLSQLRLAPLRLAPVDARGHAQLGA
jgi:hypothetical protein